MKHLTKKISLAGGKGSKPKPSPAQLLPPALGEHKLAASFSYGEMLDLISDGPIEGLVNKRGAILKGRDILQGIYLDGTAVAVTDESTYEEDLAIQETIDSLTAEDDYSELIGDAFLDLLTCPVQTTYSSLHPPHGYKLLHAYYQREWSNAYHATGTITTILPVNLEVEFMGGTYGRIGRGSYKGWMHEHLQEYYIEQPNKFFMNLSHHFLSGGGGNKILKWYQGILDDSNDRNSITKDFIDKVVKEKLGDDALDSHSTDLFKNFLLGVAGHTVSWLGGEKVKPIFIVNASDYNVYDPNAFLKDDGDGGKTVDYNLRLVLQATDANSDMAGEYYSFAYPILNDTGVWEGKVGGFHLFVLDTTFKDQSINISVGRGGGRLGKRLSWSVNRNDLNYLSKIDRQDMSNKLLGEGLSQIQGQKYNYSNILAEFRHGEERQSPFKYFNKVFIDHDYNRSLLGPFSVVTQVQRIKEGVDMLTKTPTVNIAGIPEMNGLWAKEEGSLDSSRLTSQNYSNWDQNTLTFDEKAMPITHTVENPNVESIFVSLQLNQLNDTVSQNVNNVLKAKPDGGQANVSAGSKYPCLLNIRIEVGTITADGTEEQMGYKDFQITALVESPAIIDIGNPDAAELEQDSYQYIKNVGIDNPLQGGVFVPFKLPVVSGPQIQEDGSMIIPTHDVESTPVKRYVKVTKLSTESNSTLINKDISLLKVTEVIPVNLRYPFSSIVGVKIDSRTFASIPHRTYDCKLKKIKIPSNYSPSHSDGKDKRYYNTVQDFTDTIANDKSIYSSDWDGSFVEGWTDNPAWILYDLLTSVRYGLGQYINPSQINKWELYKIARFCDAIDDDGNFVGVPDGRGGLEPRYSCNILFSEGTKVFDSINIVASLFRGAVFYGGSEINFLDDRIKEPIALFSNSNVKEGIFSYSNYRRDEQFNAVEVAYIDRFDGYKTKLEYIEEEVDIAKRGLFKKEINALGVTSKAMARRIGQHFIYQTIHENQSVTFAAGLETLLCKPGDLVIVEDELKTLSPNFGRILDVDASAGYIRIDKPFDSTEFNSGVVVYTPTGLQSSDDLDSLLLGRSRLTGFEITGTNTTLLGTDFDEFKTEYLFSGYADGFAGDANDIFPYNTQYAVYLGQSDDKPIIFYSTDHTGWVFATGQAFTAGSEFNKFITFDTGLTHFYDLESATVQRPNGNAICAYDESATDARDATKASMANTFLNDVGQLTQINQGVMGSEISLNNIPQITTLYATGDDTLEFGSRIYIDAADPNFAMLSRIPLGSAYKINRQDATDQIYKIISIKEDNSNEYSVVANKYDTGKFNLIENDISVDFLSDTFGYGNSFTVNDVRTDVLDTPQWETLVTGDGNGGGIHFTGEFTNVPFATGYQITLTVPNNLSIEKTITDTGVDFGLYPDFGFGAPGQYTFKVVALGDSNFNSTQRYLDSNYGVTGFQYFDLTTDPAFGGTNLVDVGIA